MEPDNKAVTSAGRDIGIERSRTVGRDTDPSRERVRIPPPPPRGPIARVAPRLPKASAASVQLAALAPRITIGLPNLRRNVCPHFYMTGPRGPIPIQAPHLLKALMRQDATSRAASSAAASTSTRLRLGHLPLVALQPVRVLRGRADDLTGR